MFFSILGSILHGVLWLELYVNGCFKEVIHVLCQLFLLRSYHRISHLTDDVAGRNYINVVQAIYYLAFR